jgi:hypothetical protein
VKPWRAWVVVIGWYLVLWWVARWWFKAFEH